MGYRRLLDPVARARRKRDGKQSKDRGGIEARGGARVALSSNPLMSLGGRGSCLPYP